MSFRKYAVALVALFIAVFVGTLAIRGSNCLGKDFKGGESVTLKIVQDEDIRKTVTIGEIQRIAGTIGITDVSGSYQQPVGAPEHTLAIECGLTQDTSQGEFANIRNIVSAVQTAHPELFPADAKTADDVIIGMQAVGATVSDMLITSTIISLIIALAGITIYVGLRFEMGFGMAALITTVHDVVVVTGIYLAFGGQLSASMIAALLMVAGYSINDTIVVFDRIREELALNPTMELGKVINLAINRTLTRTLMTSVTTLLTACALAYFGAGEVAEYGKVFIFGVIIGTFSSVFIASPIFYWWNKGDRKRVEESEKPYHYAWEATANNK